MSGDTGMQNDAAKLSFKFEGSTILPMPTSLGYSKYKKSCPNVLGWISMQSDSACEVVIFDTQEKQIMEIIMVPELDYDWPDSGRFLFVSPAHGSATITFTPGLLK